MQKMLNSNKFYKNKYFIVFYDETDENFVASFNNIQEICAYKNKEITSINMNLVSVELYRALRRPDNMTRMLDNSVMHVHLIDIKDIT